MRAVVKLGGALFRRDPDVNAIKSMASALSEFAKEGNQVVAVAGGGANARAYINAARKLGAEESTCDLIGIQLTRSNAELFRIALGEVGVPKIPTGIGDVPHLAHPGKVVVMGGLQPGQSTNTVAALAAEITRAEILVNGTDVEGVYTQDPKKFPKARLLATVQMKKLLDWAIRGEVFAGRYELLDPLALKIMQRAKIPSRFVSLKEPKNIIGALRGEQVGTMVLYG
jgi:uridylate kinase